VNFLSEALSFIFTAANWAGPAGLGARIVEHLGYTVIAVVFCALIAVPLGMVIGHTGKGTFLVVTGVNALRALPTLGVLLLGVLLGGLGLVPPTVALMLLGIPPLLAGTYSGVANVDRAVVDAARSMGMTESRILLRVETPNAIPLILGGLLLLLLPAAGDGATQIALLMTGTGLTGPIYVVCAPMLSEFIPTAQRGAAIAIFGAIYTLAGIIAPYVNGSIIESAATPLEGYHTGFMICALAQILGGLAGLALMWPAADRLRIARLRDRAPVAPEIPASVAR
jgi:ABC-type proline/glycine betaine transport system permease subunit